MTDAVVFTPLRQLSEQVRTRQVSPVELAETFLRRLADLGPGLNAVVTVTGERALRAARRAEKEVASGRYRGPLHGIPYGVKDLLATAGGVPTTWGAAPFREQVFGFDATVIRKLERAGAVLAAKLSMVELAGGLGYRRPDASLTGPGINPWDRQTWSGGSSSGSAAAVSAGLVPFAIGSETWGSILAPANNCGVTGLRPTYGRVSRYGAMALAWTLDKLGPLCLTADDGGLVLEAIAGRDARDPSTSRRPYRYDGSSRPSGRRFRLGVPKGVAEGAQEAVQTNFQRAIKALEPVATIEEVELPALPYEAVTRTILWAEIASAFDDFIESGQLAGLTSPEDRYLSYGYSAVLAKDYLRALRLRGVIARALDAVLSRYDALVGPARLGVASPLDQETEIAGRRARDLMGTVGNLVGLPAIGVPSGFSAEGLPTGIQFMGCAYAENTILAVASTYQSLTGWHQRHPPDLALPH